MSIKYGPPFIEVKNGRVALARTWQNGTSSGVERATNSEELEPLIIKALRTLVATPQLEGAYEAPRPLARMAHFGTHDQATDWIPLSEAQSLVGIDHAIERGHLDVKLDLSATRMKRLVRRSQVLDRWPPHRLVGTGNRLRWVGKSMNLTPRQIVSARFWQKVENRGLQHQCWPWSGGKNGRGYGIFWQDGKPHPAHRVAYELANGAIPQGKFIKRRCDNALCCNPSHLVLSDTNR
jgi:hypothetical protein